MGLKKVSVQEIVEADVVVCPVDIIEAKGYTTNLASTSGLAEDGINIPDLPNSIGHAERPGARGVWVPASSRDPYGMGNATEMKVRNEFCRC
jgi:hypothetical protein